MFEKRNPPDDVQQHLQQQQQHGGQGTMASSPPMSLPLPLGLCAVGLAKPEAPTPPIQDDCDHQ